MIKKLTIISLVLFFAISAWADTALQVDFLLSGYRHPTTDTVLSGGKVEVYLDGTSTLSALWTDKDKGGTAANPVILDSSGKAEVFGDNIYKFLIYDSDDVLIETLNGLEYIVRSQLSLTALLSDYDCNFETAKASIGTVTETHLIIDCEPDDLTDNLTFTDNVVAEWRNGYTLGGPFTLTINKVIAGKYKLFESDVTVLGLDATGEVPPEWWGDDNIAIGKALEVGRPVELISGKTYAQTATITQEKDVFIFSSGPEPAIIEPQSAINSMNFTLTATATTTLNGEVEIGDSSIIVTDASSMSAGELIKLKSNTAWYWGAGTEYKGEVHKIKSISSNTLTLYDPISDNYASTEIVAVTAYPARTVKIDNIQIKYPSAMAAVALYIGERQHSRINNFSALNFYTGKGILDEATYDTLITDMYAVGNAGASASTSYGVQTYGSVYTKITDSHFIDCRRGVDYSGDIPTRYAVTSNCTAGQSVFGSGYAGFGGHETSENCSFIGNIINGFTSAFTHRGNNITYENNTWNAPIDGLAFINTSYGGNIIASENIINIPYNERTGLTDDESAYAPQYFLNLNALFTGDVWLEGNKVLQIFNHPINGGANVGKWHVSNNYFRVVHDVADNIYLINETSLALANSKITGNEFIVDVGTKNWFRSTTTLDWDTCEIDCWDLLADSDIEVHSGTGTLSDQDVDLMVQIKQGIAKITGTLLFDVDGNTAAIRLANVQRSLSSNSTSYYNTSRQVASEQMLYIPTTADYLYISYDTAAFDTVFPVGNNYKIVIDINYKIAD